MSCDPWEDPFRPGNVPFNRSGLNPKAVGFDRKGETVRDPSFRNPKGRGKETDG